MKTWHELVLLAILFIGISGAFYIGYTVTIYDWTVAHENAHLRINEKFQIPSTINITWVGGLVMPFNGITANSTPANLTAEQWRDVRDLHLQNEIEGYNQLGLIKAVFIVGYLFTIIVSYLLCMLLPASPIKQPEK